jgi:spermidine synthase
LIYGIFFLSGVSALMFQHIWFREAGLMLGNSVLASSLVLSSFMAGLALGNGLATARPIAARHPLRWYARLELIVAITGVLLVFILPALGTTLVPFLLRFVDSGAAVGALRFGLAFVLLVIPTAAMGMTLPVLAGRRNPNEIFGATLGKLYGWNTFGAVVGALAGEAFLYEHVGIRNTAFFAGSLNVAAALLSLGLARNEEAKGPDHAEAPSSPRKREEIQWMVIAAIAGGCLLALEIVWTRFLQLSVFGTALAFAIMLAQALAGISLGSLLASRATSWCERPYAVPALAMLSAVAVTATYAGFGDILAIDVSGLPGAPWTRVSLLAGALILPVAVISGALFTSIGMALARTLPGARATGLLSLANTLGAMAGALIAGFVLLPGLGMERSFQLIAAAYALAALISPGFSGSLRRSPVLLGATILGLLFTALFPTGLMERRYLREAIGPYVRDTVNTRVSGVREGLTETIAYVDTRMQGETLYTRLVTNAFSMSGTMFTARRYMEAFVYLPVAIHPHVRRALLISYGVGSTARALADTREIEKIDVVDISKDILSMAHLAVLPGDRAPLGDPRVNAHIEDGRFFLQTSAEGYDLITSEPPPPHLGGVVNLYTLEYFKLLRRRLNPGGIVSYWLPMQELSDREGRAIASAFCAAFPDCTLWKGMTLDWILLGTRDLKGPVSDDRFASQWKEGGSRSMRDLGFELPEQLGALFMAEGARFPDLIREAPIEDNYPGRLSRKQRGTLAHTEWRESLMNVDRCRERFLASSFVSKHWPPKMRLDTLPYFAHQRHYDDMLRELTPIPGPPTSPLDAVRMLQSTPLEVLPQIVLGTSGEVGLLLTRLAARGAAEKDWLEGHLAVRDLTARRYDSAAARFRKVQALSPNLPGVGERLVLSLCLGGREAEGRAERERPSMKPSAAWNEALDAACGASNVAKVPETL